MNLKKFLLTFTTIVSIFLFIMGGITLYYINTRTVDFSKQSGILHNIISPFFNSNSPVNVLVLGGDKVSKNTDTIMLVNFNPSTSKVSILSIPRDTKVKIKNSYYKVNAAYPFGGAKLAVDTISKMLNIKIDYYVFLDASSFSKIIDILDGVDFNVPENLDYDDPTQKLHIHLKKGMQHLNGRQAEQYMRFRQYNNGRVTRNYDGSDLKRIDAQQKFIKEVVNQKLSLLYITKISQVLDTIFDNIETNVGFNEALRLLKNTNGFSSDNIQMFKLPGQSVGEDAWYYICYKSETFKIVEQYFNSRGPNSVTEITIGKHTATKRFPTVNPSNRQHIIQPTSGPMP